MPPVTEWRTLEKEWPARLLHIPTMTSTERKDEDTYMGRRRPKYNILTYTWGRWSVPEGPRLDVRGTSWQIPAVEGCFTPAEFRRVLLAMGDSDAVEFAWVDVACIDQENYGAKMEEVGRQAGIFANAYRVYAWLWTLQGELLSSSVLTLMVGARRLPFPYIERELDEEFVSLFDELETALHSVLSDPWFSSLWTLQEGVLRQDAMILSAEGQPIFRELSEEEAGRPENRNLEIRDIASALQSLYSRLRRPLSGDSLSPSLDNSMRERIDTIAKRMRNTGYGVSLLYGNSNPNVQYSAAKYRTASFELDRVYAIMALYGIKVGTSRPGSDASRTYTFPELEGEFVAELNALFPLLGQMFVHTQEPQTGQSWRITQNSRVPTLLSGYNRLSCFKDCTISVGIEGTARISGRITPLEDVFAYWKFWQPFFQIPDYDYHWSMVSFELDDHVLSTEEGAGKVQGADSFMHFDMVGHTFQYLLAGTAGPGSLSVLQLGFDTLEGSDSQNSSLYCLLVQHDVSDWFSCRRLGICVSWRNWNSDSAGIAGQPKMRIDSYTGKLH